jgi:hypothetical protein
MLYRNVANVKPNLLTNYVYGSMVNVIILLLLTFFTPIKTITSLNLNRNFIFRRSNPHVPKGMH